MNSCLLPVYRDMFLTLRRGPNNKRPSNAKPVFLLAVMSSILEGKLTKNEIYFDDNSLLEKFARIDLEYDNSTTELLKPFFCLESEPFYHLVWIDESVKCSHKMTPSSKYLREHLLYAKLDDELWELLQDTDCCKLLMQSVIDRYLTPEKTF